jgi:putative transposase
MCRVLGVAPSGYYDWLKQPISNRAQEDARLLRLIRASFIASQGIYGAPRVFLDLREAGETCSKHRVARLMRVNKLRALHGYRVRRWSIVADYIDAFYNRTVVIVILGASVPSSSKRLRNSRDGVSTKSWELQRSPHARNNGASDRPDNRVGCPLRYRGRRHRHIPKRPSHSPWRVV